MTLQGYYFQNGDDKFQGSVLSFQAVGRQDVGLYGKCSSWYKPMPILFLTITYTAFLLQQSALPITE